MFEEILAVIISLSCTFGGLTLLHKFKDLQKNGRRADGVVFKREHVYESENSTYNYTIRFVTADGVWITSKLQNGIIKEMYPGDKVTVLYDPEEPKNFMLDNSIGQMALSWLLILAGIGGLIIVVLELLELTNVFL